MISRKGKNNYINYIEEAYAKGASDMEKAKQIIIDNLLKQLNEIKSLLPMCDQSDNKELSELPNEYSEKLWKKAYDIGYDKGRTDEIMQSIEDAKMQATEYLNALDKAKEAAYQQGAREFAEWLLINHTMDCIECNCGDKSIGCKECANEYVAEWQKGEEE